MRVRRSPGLIAQDSQARLRTRDKVISTWAAFYSGMIGKKSHPQFSNASRPPPCRSSTFPPGNFTLPVNHSTRLKPRKPLASRLSKIRRTRLSEPRTATHWVSDPSRQPQWFFPRRRPFPALVLQLQRLLNLLSSNCSPAASADKAGLRFIPHKHYEVPRALLEDRSSSLPGRCAQTLRFPNQNISYVEVT